MAGPVRSGYTSPPLSQDPYRASPVPMQARSPYMSSALSPPPSSSGFAPLPSSSSRHHVQASGTSQYASRSGSARYPTASPYAPPQHQHQQVYGGYPPLPVPPQQTPQQKFKGTLAPGTVIKVGESHVRIERYLSEGGYAHVYLTTSERPVYPPAAGAAGSTSKGRWGDKGYTQHCLKRIAFEDEKVWVDVRKEIEVMVSVGSGIRCTRGGSLPCSVAAGCSIIRGY
jgi:AP2-associated kinase